MILLEFSVTEQLHSKHCACVQTVAGFDKQPLFLRNFGSLCEQQSMTNNMNKQHMFREVFMERSLEWGGGDKREPDNWHLRVAL